MSSRSPSLPNQPSATRVLHHLQIVYGFSRKTIESSPCLFSERVSSTNTCVFLPTKDGLFDSIGLRLTTRHGETDMRVLLRVANSCHALETYLPITFVLIKKQGQVVVPFDSKQTLSSRKFYVIIRSSTLHALRRKKRGASFPFFSCNNHGDSARKFKRGQVARVYQLNPVYESTCNPA